MFVKWIEQKMFNQFYIFVDFLAFMMYNGLYKREVISMTLSEFIQQYRHEHRMSQRQLASACQLSNGYISMLEKNLNPNTGLPLTPTLPVLKKLASGMGMDLGDMLSAVDDMPIEVDTAKNGLNSGVGTETMDDIDLKIMSLLASLTPESKQRVLGYIQGLADQT